VVDGAVAGMMEAERYFRQKRYKLHCLTTAPGKHQSGYQYVDVDDFRLFLSFVQREWGASFDAVAVQTQGRVGEYENVLATLGEAGFKFGEAALVNHHLCHAALAFYTSPFEDAVVLSYDGGGNDGQTLVFQADQASIRYVERNSLRFGQSYNNVGYIAGIAPDITGTTAGKLMGLAAYGQLREDWLPFARTYVRKYRKLPPRRVDGLNAYGQAHRINAVGLEAIDDLRAFLVPAEGDGPGVLGKARRAVFGGAPLSELRLPGPEHPLAHDLAHTVQAAWTQEVLDLLRPHRGRSANLCLTGGCALNGITNYAIQESGLFARVHFIPNPTDCGLSAGAALQRYHRRGGRPFHGYGGYFSPYVGSEPFDLGALPALRQAYAHRALPGGDVPRVLAGLVHRGLIVGVIRGRYEVGPRALGHRSILCNPLVAGMRDVLNHKVKHREWYRPFAPVVSAEDAATYFTRTDSMAYMSVVSSTRAEWVERLPSVTHVDGSARLQTVTRDQDRVLYDTLKEFERLSGVPIMLNTSFNPRGEPILNFCAVGLAMLDTTDLDLVLIEDTLFCRRGREELLASA
jgi:predicted NodU family carbamoyl transferase